MASREPVHLFLALGQPKPRLDPTQLHLVTCCFFLVSR